AVLAYLAVDGTESADGTFWRAPLPAAAVALIDKFRRDPRPADQPGQGADQDDTFGSLPQPGSPSRSARQSFRPRARSGSGGGGHRGGYRNPMMVGAAAAVSALMLLGAGVAAGTYFVHRAPGSGNSSGSSPQIGTTSTVGPGQNGFLP